MKRRESRKRMRRRKKIRPCKHCLAFSFLVETRLIRKDTLSVFSTCACMNQLDQWVEADAPAIFQGPIWMNGAHSETSTLLPSLVFKSKTARCNARGTEETVLASPLSKYS
jgi:hypothetical protein